MLHVVVVDENIIRIDLESAIGSDVNAVLFASPRCLASLSESNRSWFRSIRPTSDFSFSSLAKELEAMIAASSPTPVNIVTNDECVGEVCALLRSHFGLRGDSYETAQRFASKLLAKDVIAEAIPDACPAYMEFDPRLYLASPEAYLGDIVKRIGMPIVAKPIRGTSSSGVQILGSADELKTWAETFEQGDHFELESFIQGTLYHCDAIVQGGVPVFVAIGEGSYPCLDYCFGRNVGTLFLPEESETFQKIKSFNAAVLKALGAPDGTTHMEVFVQDDGALKFVEISDRPPGGDIQWMHQVCTGINWETAHFRIRMGLPFLIEKQSSSQFAGWYSFPRRAGIVRRLNTPAISSRGELIWAVNIDDMLTRTYDLTTPRAGGIRLSNKSYAELRQDFEMLKKFVPYHVEDEACL